MALPIPTRGKAKKVDWVPYRYYLEVICENLDHLQPKETYSKVQERTQTPLTIGEGKYQVSLRISELPDGCEEVQHFISAEHQCSIRPQFDTEKESEISIKLIKATSTISAPVQAQLDVTNEYKDVLKLAEIHLTPDHGHILIEASVFIVFPPAFNRRDMISNNRCVPLVLGIPLLVQPKPTWLQTVMN